MSRLMFVMIGALFSGLFIWAYQFEVDQVIRAEARVVPVKDVVQVQNRFAGTLQRVQVDLGDQVQQGDVLFEIDPEGSAIDLLQTRQALRVAQAEQARFKALIENTTPAFSTGIPADLRASQQALLLAKRNEQSAKDRSLEMEARTLSLSVKEARASARAALAQVELIQEEINIVEPLVTAKAEPEVRLIRLRREQSELSDRAALGELSAQRYEAEIDSINSQRQQLANAFALEQQELLAQVEVEIERLEKEVDRADERASRSQVVSPIDGIVTALPYAVVGQIADAGTVLAEVVPAQTDYQVEARLRPVDVGNVRLGQLARLSLAAYDFADYGHIDARLTEVAQTITEEPQAEPYYKAILAIDAAQFSKSGVQADLMPGLLGQIDVLGDPITVLSYVTKPISKLGGRALTEQ